MFLDTFTESELDRLVLAEPLACVIHAYARFSPYVRIQTAVIYGGGPIGALHLIEIGRRFPQALRYVIEPNPVRRELVQKLFPSVAVHTSNPLHLQADLTIVASSHPQASMDAVANAADAGLVVLFSGINHKSKDELPVVQGIDLEAVHRNEEVRVAQRDIRLIGSSGYHEVDIRESVKLLLKSPQPYAITQTAIVNGLDAKASNKYVIEEMLNSPEEYESHLKAVFRMDWHEKDMVVIPNEKLDKAIVRQFSLNGEVPKGMVRVKMLRASICQTDRRVLNGTKACCGFNSETVLGHEGIGIIETANRETEHLVGRIVVVLPHHYFEDPLVQRGLGFLSRKMKHLGIHVNGVFATRIDVPEGCVQVIERDVEDAGIVATKVRLSRQKTLDLVEQEKVPLGRVKSNAG